MVEDARQKDSPLHSLFNWNVKEAAYALQQAREIIAWVPYEQKTTHYHVSGTRYVPDPDAKVGYVNMDVLRERRTSARQSLIDTLNVAAGHLRRAVELAEQLDLETELDDLLGKILGVQRLLREAA